MLLFLPKTPENDSMIFRKVFIISLLLLFSSCAFEERPFEERPHVTFTGDANWYTIRVNILDDWKIVNAQLESNLLHLELDKGKGKEKLSLPLLFPLKNFNQDVLYRGANRLGGMSLLHFTKEDEEQGIKFQLGKSDISKGLKSREVLAVYRVGNRLYVHFRIENTSFGDAISHNLKEQYLIDVYYKKKKTDRPFKITKGNFKLEFGVNHKKNRIIPMNELIEQSEEFVSGAEYGSFEDRKLVWICLFELVSK